MRIKQIRLKNGFKRFNDLTINLGDNPKKIIALVGPNGSGKSSVFDGMTYVNAVGNYGHKSMEFYSMLGNRISTNDIELSFDSDKKFNEVWKEKNSAGKGNTIFSFRNSYRYNSNLNIDTLQKITDFKENRIGASSSVDLDDRMTENYQRLYVYLNNYRKVNNLTDIQANDQVIGELNKILSECLGLKIASHGDIIAGKGTLFFKKDNQPSEFSFNVLSSGEKEVVDILLDIYLKRKDFDDSIYIIDEPELHLNTAIQKKLLIEIEKLIPDTCQIWVATHSIGFLNALKNELNEKSDVIDFDGDFSSKPETINPIIKNRSNWQKLFKTALEDLTGLVAPETIIYCEGRKEPTATGEEQGLDAEIYNQIFAEEFPDVLFVSSGGSGESDKLASVALLVLNKAFKDVELVLLKDKDINRDGTPTSDAQRQTYLTTNGRSHRMLRRKEIENYLFDFEIISKVYPEVNEEEYNKLIPDIIDGDVKAKAGNVMELCKVSGRGFNKDAFKKLLAQSITRDTRVYRELKEVIFLIVEMRAETDVIEEGVA